jgi:hypothetical protein
MVKTRLSKLQPKTATESLAHTTIHVSYQGMEGTARLSRRASSTHKPVSSPEQTPMNGVTGRKENLSAPHLCLAENVGLPEAGAQITPLYGNGVTVVPNVHVVMTWAAQNTRATTRGISGEELRNPRKGGGRVTALQPRNETRGDNECYQTEP